jgi:hypothetical protein
MLPAIQITALLASSPMSTPVLLPQQLVGRSPGPCARGRQQRSWGTCRHRPARPDARPVVRSVIQQKASKAHSSNKDAGSSFCWYINLAFSRRCTYLKHQLLGSQDLRQLVLLRSRHQVIAVRYVDSRGNPRVAEAVGLCVRQPPECHHAGLRGYHVPG